MKYAASKKAKEAFAIVERLRESGTILDMRVADNLPKAVLHLKDRFDEETASARNVNGFLALFPGTVPEETPAWVGETKFLFSTGGNKKSLEIITCPRI